MPLKLFYGFHVDTFKFILWCHFSKKFHVMIINIRLIIHERRLLINVR